MLTVGLIGCGNVTLTSHIPAIMETSGVEIVAAADPTADRLEAVRAAAGLDRDRSFEDWRRLVARPEIDAVLVATPQRFRPEIAIAAAGAGKHLLCEKPLAISPAGARHIVEPAETAGVTLATVHNYAFMPVYRLLKEVATDDRIGQVEVAILNYMGVEDRPGAAAYSPRWRHFAAQAGGGVLMDMLHAVYLCGWLLDDSPISVSATVDKRFDDDGDVEDLALVRFGFPDGHHAMVNMAWGVGPGGIELTGTDGRAIMLTRGHATHPFAPAEEIAVFGPYGEQVLIPGEPARYGLAGVWADFRDAIQGGREPAASGAAAEEVLSAVVGAYASAAMGRETTLPLQPGDPFFEHGALAVAGLDLPESSPVRRRGLFGFRNGS